jgi:hypothetical protein
MTTIAQHRPATQRGILAQLALALLVGATAGSALTLQLVTPTGTGAAALPSAVDVSTTTAGEQYRDWYSRARDLAGSTTAGRQYSDWYAGQAAGSRMTTASEQYRAWYVDGNRVR